MYSQACHISNNSIVRGTAEHGGLAPFNEGRVLFIKKKNSLLLSQTIVLSINLVFVRPSH